MTTPTDTQQRAALLAALLLKAAEVQQLLQRLEENRAALERLEADGPSVIVIERE